MGSRWSIGFQYQLLLVVLSVLLIVAFVRIDGEDDVDPLGESLIESTILEELVATCVSSETFYVVEFYYCEVCMLEDCFPTSDQPYLIHYASYSCFPMGTPSIAGSGPENDKYFIGERGATYHVNSPKGEILEISRETSRPQFVDGVADPDWCSKKLEN